TVARLIAPFTAYRQRGRAPEITTCFVADIDHLTRRIHDRIVGPWRQLVFAAVRGPGVATAFSRYLKAELRVGHNIYPGHGRGQIPAERNDVLASLLVKASQAIEIFEILRGWRRWQAGHQRRRPGREHRLRPRGGLRNAGQLLAYLSVPCLQNNSCNGLNQLPT